MVRALTFCDEPRSTMMLLTASFSSQLLSQCVPPAVNGILTLVSFVLAGAGQLPVLSVKPGSVIWQRLVFDFRANAAISGRNDAARVCSEGKEMASRVSVVDGRAPNRSLDPPSLG